MRPIDWQPTTAEDGAMPGHARAGSSASSFHSGNGHESAAHNYGSTTDHGYGATTDHGYGATTDHGYGATVDHGYGSNVDHGYTVDHGYGSTMDHVRSPSPLAPPEHDFTAGPANLAPVGGYADLARGPSPQPQMQEALARGPSLTRPQYDQYGVPLHHQGGGGYTGQQDAYDYHTGY